MVFFTTRFAKRNIDDWRKLIICISYLNQTLDGVGIIWGFNLADLYTWVYASYTIHPNMSSQTGELMSMGYIILHFQSSKQKLNENFQLRMNL